MQINFVELSFEKIKIVNDAKYNIYIYKILKSFNVILMFSETDNL